MQFALNHIAAPHMALPDFFEMCTRLGVSEVEIRNDTPDTLSAMTPAEVKQLAADHGITIASVNALYPFNLWQSDLPARAAEMIAYAGASGAKGVAICPLNEAGKVTFKDTVAALAELKPLFDDAGVTGLVEPLGFSVSSLRYKADALRAIEEAGGGSTYTLLHDTFHHFLAGETECFGPQTGLVHVSGITAPELSVEEMLDAHRVLVDADDRLENISQIKALLAAGYRGSFSVEPFSPEFHALAPADIEAALARSMAFMREQVAQPAL